MEGHTNGRTLEYNTVSSIGDSTDILPQVSHNELSLQPGNLPVMSVSKSSAAASETVSLASCPEMTVFLLQERILGLYSTDQDEEGSPGGSLRPAPQLRKRSRRLGREEHRQTLFIAD